MFQEQQKRHLLLLFCMKLGDVAECGKDATFPLSCRRFSQTSQSVHRKWSRDVRKGQRLKLLLGFDFRPALPSTCTCPALPSTSTCPLFGPVASQQRNSSGCRFPLGAALVFEAAPSLPGLLS